MLKNRIFLFFLSMMFLFSCNKNDMGKEKLLVKVIYDLIAYDAIDVIDIQIVDSEGVEWMLSEKVNSTKLVFYLPDLGCSSCYEQELSLVRKMIPDDVKEKVMVIGSFSNVRELKLFERESGFSTYKMNNVTENFPMYMYNETSVVFLLTEQLKCHAFFDAVNNVDASKLY